MLTKVCHILRGEKDCLKTAMIFSAALAVCSSSVSANDDTNLLSGSTTKAHTEAFVAFGPGGDPGGMPPFPGDGPIGGGHMGPPPFGMMGPGGPPPHMMLPLHGIDLSDDQIEKMAQQKSDFMDKVGPVQTKLHSLEHQFGRLLSEPQLSMSELNSVRSQMNTQKQTLDSMFTEHMVAMAQLLTPEQRRQIKLRMERAELGQFGGEHPKPANKVN